jgi:hypothetical protein
MNQNQQFLWDLDCDRVFGSENEYEYDPYFGKDHEQEQERAREQERKPIVVFKKKVESPVPEPQLAEPPVAEPQVAEPQVAELPETDELEPTEEEHNYYLDYMAYRAAMKNIRENFVSEHPMFPMMIPRYLNMHIKRSVSIQHAYIAIQLALSNLKCTTIVSPYVQQIGAHYDYHLNIKTTFFMIRHPDEREEDINVYSKINTNAFYGADLTKPQPTPIIFDTSLLEFF